MLARCAVCAHSQRAILDARLLAGEALMPLANEYGLRSRDLRHHRDEHVRWTARASKESPRVW
jgi:hypothetical protein